MVPDRAPNVEASPDYLHAFSIWWDDADGGVILGRTVADDEGVIHSDANNPE